MAFNNILVPYDGSVASLRAFNKAVELAKQHNSYIKVLSCLDLGNLGGWYIDKRINKDIMKKAKKITEELFSKLDDIAKKNSVLVDFKIIESKNTVKSIISFTKSKKIDLVILGSSGRGSFDKILLGSVSNGVMQKAKCPVLIIK
ncbi:MAG: universal stress protein [Nitrosopumilus sp.]|nr:universal stress protein [Nitrosopumilus sp.]MDH3515508.1 universal stress protein [Nitrosopumilus sp.]MDH3565575.1 universal stress protein [Nitrosopumilus sp.]MDH5416728.1 universal stress protein [Nitrosopumilus sp.]MDH5555191.1 universal stress protein [Nitrosopumilus sp.]